MRLSFELHGRRAEVDLSESISLSIPLISGQDGPNCFYAPLFEASPVRMGDFVGSTSEGGIVNFFNVRINPHGNGTHTECVGHIAKEALYLPDVLDSYQGIAELMTIWPTKMADGDLVILPDQLDLNLSVECLVIRTMPNPIEKKNRSYSGTNPCYFHPDTLQKIRNLGIKHLLVDLPSVDREEDGGALLSHKYFWDYPATLDRERTITELIFVPDQLPDGLYFIGIHVLPIQLDVSPSQVTLTPVRFG